MGSSDQINTFSDADALQWARTFSAFDSTELVSDWPWARTHRLLRGAEAAYLKLLPLQQAKMIAPVAALAQRFPQRMPTLIAHDSARGFLLSADHGGRALDYDSADEDIRTLAASYATLQADAARSPALFAGLPRPDIAALPQQLLDFLAPTGPLAAPVSGHVNGDYFIGAESAAQYRQALQRRLHLIEQHLLPAADLPATVNHGDLRPPNAAMTAAGNCVIMDWDDAVVGPAGMSVQGLFSGCVVPTILLSGSAAAEAAAETPHGRLVHAYIDALVQGGYADAARLKRALPAAMCAGLIQFMLNFSAFPGEGGREGVAETLKARLDDLLDVCDLIASRSAPTALEFAQDYEDHQQLRRAQYLLQDHVLRQPDDLGAVKRLGSLLRRRSNLEQAEQTYREALERAPADAALHAGLGAVLMERLAVAQSRGELARAVELDPAHAAAREDLERVLAIEAMQANALQPERMPILTYDAADAAAGVVRPELLALGAALFEAHGTLQIDNAFAADEIAKLHDVFITRYAAYFREDNHPDALRLGDKRYMLTVDLDDPHGLPALIGAPMVLPLIRRVLGDDCVLGAYTAVISLPGSRDQRLHKDHPALFPDTEWHFKLPCFAAQIIIPLVPLDDMSGTTRFYKGTHRIPTEEAEAQGAQDPLVPLGSCLLTDYRCAHRGRGNRSARVRPILTLIFNRPWFRDFKNYGKQPPLRITDDAFRQMPDDLKRLVAWWKEERKLNALEHSLLGN